MTDPSLAAANRGAVAAIPLLPAQTLVGFVAAVIAVIFMAVFSYRTLETRSTTAELVTRTLKTMEGLESFLSALSNAESAQRGYLLTGKENYLTAYTTARADVPVKTANLHNLILNQEQIQRLNLVEQTVTEKLAELDETIELRRSGNSEAALALVQTNRGKAATDQIRIMIQEMQKAAQDLLDERQAQWESASTTSVLVTTVGGAILLLLIAAAAIVASRDFRAREIQVWLRTGQMGFGTRLQGDQRLDKLGDTALEFLADYLAAQIGAIYVAESGGSFHRIAGYATSSEAIVRLGDGLLGQAAKENRVLHVQDLPERYLPVTSTLGKADSRELIVAPASADGIVQAVIELGFFRKLRDQDRELLERLSESLGVAVRSAKDRTRLEELLEETQRQSEELQTQQEELRTSNEELEVQAHALKESQTQLQSQQAELEQINSHLEEQAQALEHQKEELSKGQIILADKAVELERANQYKSEFLANMSHELRTPLNSSLILAKILADNKPGNLSDEQVKFANTILGAGNDLLAIINDVLDLSKIEAGKVELTVEPVSLRRTVDSLTKSFQPVAQQKDLEFEVIIDSGTREHIESDAQRLAQILKNLLSNAFKFTEQGKVTLRLFTVSESAIGFSVSDSGIGIAAHQQQIIFEAFRQADGSTHRRFGGTGLGLSISRDLAHLLGGEITVESAPSKGSVFLLTLPVTHSGIVVEQKLPPIAEPRTEFQAISSREPPRHEARVNSVVSAADIEDDRERLAPGSRVILVIEDDVRFATILRDLARERGFQCIVTHSANDGLAAAKKWLPSAILLDINLPDHSGLGVLDQLKRNSQTRHIPVHVASVADFTKEALGLGAVGYALKPVKREELETAFQRLEAKFSQGLRHVLVVEDDARQRDSLRQLLVSDNVEIIDVESAGEALKQLQSRTFDCMVMDLNLPDLSGYDLLQKMAEKEEVSFPPVIVYTGRSLTRDEEQQLRRFSKSIIIKDARSPERLLDEVMLFLHQVEEKMPKERQQMLRVARDRESLFENRRILIAEDDVRNVFALTSLLESKGMRIEIARNGREAISTLTRSLEPGANAIDLVLMDIMMPEMDGITAMLEIRKRVEWKKLPIIALTAKAMRDDQEKCLAAGANDYMAKPLDVERLLSLIRVWLPK